ncbi:MAG: SH3 domain-containing protein [Leptospirales bacterium]|nr:SH3 domain-containing protein [Leptospirales bacterium]
MYSSARSGLRLRLAPRSDSETLAVIPFNAELTVLSKSQESITVDGITAPWMQVRYQGQEGWVFGGYLVAAVSESPPDQLRERYLGVWNGRNLCEGVQSNIAIDADGRFTARLFGGCDISGCSCGALNGRWKLQDRMICFQVEHSDFQVATGEGPSCYRMSGRSLIAAQNAFVENYGSETLQVLQRPASAPR